MSVHLLKSEFRGHSPGPGGGVMTTYGELGNYVNGLICRYLVPNSLPYSPHLSPLVLIIVVKSML